MKSDFVQGSSLGDALSDAPLRQSTPRRKIKSQEVNPMLRILKTHPELVPYQKDLDLRMALYRKKRKQILGKTNTLVDFANAHTYYGFHNTPAGWIYREWAPGADQLYLTGDFNDWRWTDTVLPGKSPLFLKFVELYLWYSEIRFFPFVLVDGAGERSIS